MLIILIAGALLIGATGTWSPCGFSMIETIGPTGHTGGRSTTLAACATFFPGALTGGAFTFGGLAMIGEALFGSAGVAAYAAAAAVALLAAVAEARGTRIVPQIRRQLPEHWRRVMPMPLASGLYGVLLGLGFTTFVLTFGVWALAAISLAAGDAQLGLLIGLAFGVGRAIPIISIAPFADRPFGQRATELMAEGTLYRGARLGDAAALLAAGTVLVVHAGDAAAAGGPTARHAGDASASNLAVAYQRQGPRTGVLRPGGGKPLRALPGTDPAIDARHVAVIDGPLVRILARDDALTERGHFQAKGADALAISGQWIVYRTRVKGADRLYSRRLSKSGVPSTDPRVLAKAGGSTQLGRPSADAGRIVYARAGRSRNTILLRSLTSKRQRKLRSSGSIGLSNPSLLGNRFIYVEDLRGKDRIRSRRLNGKRPGKVIVRHKRIWSTELARHRIYYTTLRGTNPGTTLYQARR